MGVFFLGEVRHPTKNDIKIDDTQIYELEHFMLNQLELVLSVPLVVLQVATSCNVLFIMFLMFTFYLHTFLR